MPTAKNRINLTVDDETFLMLEQIAEKKGQKIGTVSLGLLKEALELIEDEYWSKEADNRLQSLKDRKPISHDEVWD
ncbi:MAG: hypothetical protein HRU09_16850 [Oligoflexales bacterium]|nr:hypothetical protein [Oligoflexales bacterium]